MRSEEFRANLRRSKFEPVKCKLTVAKVFKCYFRLQALAVPHGVFAERRLVPKISGHALYLRLFRTRGYCFDTQPCYVLIHAFTEVWSVKRAVRSIFYRT